MERIEVIAEWFESILKDRFQTTFVETETLPEIGLVMGKVMLGSGEQYLIYIEQLENKIKMSAVLWDDTEETYVVETMDWNTLSELSQFQNVILPAVYIEYTKEPKNMKVNDGTVLVDALRFFHLVSVILLEKDFNNLTYWELEEAVYLITNEILVQKLERAWLETNKKHYENIKITLEIADAEYWNAIGSED